MKKFSFFIFISLVLIDIKKTGADVNPECQGLKNLASNLKAAAATGVASFVAKVQNVNCQVFQNCSGIWCSGSAFGASFNGSLYLEHCSNPIKVLLHLKVPAKKINEWRVFENSRVITFQVPTPILPTTLSITPNFTRQNNHILLKFKACGANIITKKVCRNTQATSVQVSRKHCPTQKPGPSTRSKVVTNPGPTTAAKPDQSTQTSLKTTQKISVASKQKPNKPTSHAKQSTSMPVKPSKKPKPTIRPTTNVVPSQEISSKNPKPPRTYKPHSPLPRKDRTGKAKTVSHGLSTGAEVGIAVSVILVLLLILGLVVYWRRLKRRGPMYYNDIFVNRADNFEDDEPLFDSHLVL